MEKWIENQKLLLGIERESEREELSNKLNTLSAQECSELGLSILRLEIESTRAALYGRTAISVQRKDRKNFPTNNFKVGDEVKLYSTKAVQGHNDEVSHITGIVSKASADCVELITDASEFDILEFPLRLDLLSSEATHKKMMEGLIGLEKRNIRSWPIANILFDCGTVKSPIPVEITPFNVGLNQSQVRKMLQII